MISLIICSRTKALNQHLKANIEDTIGYAFEIIVIDNSNNIYNIFNDPDVGAIGIAGSPNLTKTPSSWWAGGLINQHLCHWENSELKIYAKYFKGEKAFIKQVVALDGVWFCIKKTLFNQIRFDEEHYKGFHFYDIDISVQIHSLGYKLLTVYDVLLEHNSIGDINILWIENAEKFNKKWQHCLPLRCVDISYNEYCRAELKSIKEFSEIEIGNNVSKKKSYLSAVKKIIGNYKLYFSYLTPKYFIYFLFKYLNP